MKKHLPAFQIPLTKTELTTLGELCAIQGQVEYLFIVTLSYLMDLPQDIVRKMLSSSSLHTNANTWIAIFQEKCHDEKVLRLAEAAFALVTPLTQGRNDFVHALFASSAGESWMLLGFAKGARHPPAIRNAAIALRTRNLEKRRPIADLKRVRNDAAQLSVLLSEIAWSFLPDPDSK